MIGVLRIGHRPGRDKRVTTHVGLVARAFGANVIFIDAEDERIRERLTSVCERFGGEIDVHTGVDWREKIKTWDGVTVHLTMYGRELNKALKELPDDDLLIVVGAEKVPAEVYHLVDFNVAVGNQPHSEIAALAVFLDRYTEGTWVDTAFKGGEIRIIPCERGKHVEHNNEEEKSE